MDILTIEDNSTEQRLMNSRLSCIAHLKYKVLSVVLHCALLFNGERFLHWQCPTVFDHNVCRGPIIGTSLHILNDCDNILQAARTTESIIKTLCANREERREGAYHSVEDLPKHDMPAIQPLGLDSGDEELGTIGILASIGHAHPTRPLMLQFEVLVRKLVAIYTFAWARIQHNASIYGTHMAMHETNLLCHHHA